MVLLTMTPAVVRALSAAAEASPEAFAKLQQPSEPTLADAKAGNPVSHSQLIDLSKLLKKNASEGTSKKNTTEATTAEAAQQSAEHSEPPPTTLDALLRGSTIYTPPPPPKKAPTPEFTRLMARLRAEEEARAYERMTNPNPLAKPESFSQRYPSSIPFSVGADVRPSEEDEMSYEEVHRQIILIINVIVSIVACAVFVWIAARHWSVPKRLGLSMGSSGAVAIAEVVVYSGYVRKVAEAKRREKKKPEIKEIVQSWIIDSSSSEQMKEAGTYVGAKEKTEVLDGVRYRKGRHR
jgi:hypothetical protein